MRKRAGLAEHPFGTLKVWGGWTHFLVRGLSKVRGEWHLLLTCYNFKRVLNIIGFDAFRDYCHQRMSASRQPVRVIGNQEAKSVLEGGHCEDSSGCEAIFRPLFDQSAWWKVLCPAVIPFYRARFFQRYF